MRFSWSSSLVIGCTIVVVTAFMCTGAQEPKVVPIPVSKEEPAKPRIVPVVALKPGETKELLMSTSCALDSRSGGLIVREMGDGEKKKDRTLWKKDGITIEIPRTGEYAESANASVYAPIKSKGLNAFVVKVTASKEAKTGLIDMHLASETCNGTCATDFRVLVVAP
jgi:hypothetical protein